MAQILNGHCLIKIYNNSKTIVLELYAPPEGIEQLTKAKSEQVGIAYKSISEVSPSRSTRKDFQIEAQPYDPLKLAVAFYQYLGLADGSSAAALALEFTILNACRTGEVLNGLRNEIVDSVWTIPATRMKAGNLHQIPLTQRSLDILTIARSLDPDSKYLFSRKGKPLSSMSMLMLVRRLQYGLTVHGFRSTFRDWIAEETDYSPEVAEMALAHTIGNKVERAYRRGNLMEPRRRLMTDWASFCMTGTWGNVVPITQRRTA